MDQRIGFSLSKWFMLICPWLVACVGPTTPFGAINPFQSPTTENSRALASSSEITQIYFHPSRQVLHGSSDLSIEIKDKHFIPYEYDIRIYHNSYDVTQEFLSQSHQFRSRDGKQLIFTLKNFRLKALDPNKIKVVFQKDQNSQIQAYYKPPLCSLFESRHLASVQPFKPPQKYLTMIESVAKTANYNPSLLAGIVAQESGFNPKAVSWAKAIGLTQMTPLAEQEVIENYKDWPRHPGINDLTYVTLKSKIYLGEIDNSSEWRLDPEKSLQGGVAYINYLTQYWGMENNLKIIDSLPGDPKINFSEVVLASYNSGAARVKSVLLEDGENWKKNSSLKEAIKYLKKVSSFCFHFAKKEIKDDRET